MYLICKKFNFFSNLFIYVYVHFLFAYLYVCIKHVNTHTHILQLPFCVVKDQITFLFPILILSSSK